jgi:septal ring factor EnvC (AmiA/AmiB activator)
MRLIQLFFCFILIFVPVASTFAQGGPTRAQLEAKRREIQDAISQTERQLDEIKKDKNATLGQLKALQYKLAQRQNLISSINDEIGEIDQDITKSSKEIVTLKQKLGMLKVRYAQSIRYAYQTRSSYDMLAYLFSSSNFNDMVRRMKYLRKFRDFRKKQVDQILSTQHQIQGKIVDLNKVKEEKDNLLKTQKGQTVALIQDVKETNTVFKDLKGRESELLRQAQINRRIADNINRQIQAIIMREMEEAARKARIAAEKNAAAGTKPTVVPKTTTTHTTTGHVDNVPVPGGTSRIKTAAPDAPPLLLTPTEAALADNFEGNRGKLYWPVVQGSIVDRFGRHPHPLEPRVFIDNNGIDIRTTPNAAVRAVFDGTVSSVFVVEGFKIILIQHGNYFTVYNNLASASVTKGQEVKTGQTIGTVANNDEGVPTVKFQIWKSSGKQGQVKLDPEAWIGRSH